MKEGNGPLPLLSQAVKAKKNKQKATGKQTSPDGEATRAVTLDPQPQHREERTFAVVAESGAFCAAAGPDRAPPPPRRPAAPAHEDTPSRRGTARPFTPRL